LIIPFSIFLNFCQPQNNKKEEMNSSARSFAPVPEKRIVIQGGVERSLNERTVSIPEDVLLPHPQPLKRSKNVIYAKGVVASSADGISRASEKLNQTFLNSGDVIDPSVTNIFANPASVLYRGAADALIAVRYINEDQVQSVELKYYNESTGLSFARPFAVDFQLIPTVTPLFPTTAPAVHASLRRGPIIVPSNYYTSLGLLHKTNDGSGLFGYFMFIDAAISQIPLSVQNTKEIFTGPFDNIYPSSSSF
jgi:hypothetical protein